uniref:Uncharacterized protein n=1 Tax=Rhizophora mucronata TaxID=61149 RepID=A0A2P2PYQ7_RHIMU
MARAMSLRSAEIKEGELLWVLLLGMNWVLKIPPGTDTSESGSAWT